MKKLMILTAVVGVLALFSVTNVQAVDVAVSFDEAGTMFTSAIPTGSEFHVYVVAYDLQEILGYEFLLDPSVLPSYLLGKVAYGPAPQDFGTDYEVRAGTGGCVTDPAMMGADAGSWTLTMYKVMYFADPGPDVYFCVAPSPGSGAPTPQFTICDQTATIFPMYPGQVDNFGNAPEGCGVGNPTKDYDIVGAETTSWGSLKAGF